MEKNYAVVKKERYDELEKTWETKVAHCKKTAERQKKVRAEEKARKQAMGIVVKVGRPTTVDAERTPAVTQTVPSQPVIPSLPPQRARILPDLSQIRIATRDAPPQYTLVG
jgi:hypothetical protein